MVKVYCDRCGKHITDKPKYKFDIVWEGQRGNGVCYSVPNFEDKQSSMNICVECYNDFKKFFGHTE